MFLHDTRKRKNFVFLETINQRDMNKSRIKVNKYFTLFQCKILWRQTTIIKHGVFFRKIINEIVSYKIQNYQQ